MEILGNDKKIEFYKKNAKNFYLKNNFELYENTLNFRFFLHQWSGVSIKDLGLPKKILKLI